MMKYLDLDLHIWKEGDRYAVEVTGSPAGQSDRDYMLWPFPEEEQALLTRLEAMVRSRSVRSGPALSPAEAYLREFGTDIFNAVFGKATSVASVYKESLAKSQKNAKGLRINLRVDPPEWANLPWEYVFDEHSYLCLQTDSPVVRRLSAQRGAHPIKVRNPVRILGMLVNLSGEWRLPDAENERRRMEEIMKPAGVDFMWTQRATPDSLIDAMQNGPWDIFHFIGHGGSDQEIDTTGKLHTLGYLVMDDGYGKPIKVWADKLATILESGGIKLAVINCCDSARGHSNSVGAALVDQGIPMAIAMQFGISDASAARFSERFYYSLAKGETAECALTWARKAVQATSDVEWAVPIMYSQSAPLVFFSVGGKQQAIAPASVVVPTPIDDARAQAQAELRRLWNPS